MQYHLDGYARRYHVVICDGKCSTVDLKRSELPPLLRSLITSTSTSLCYPQHHRGHQTSIQEGILEIGLKIRHFILSFTLTHTTPRPRTHPDRLSNASTEEKKAATEKFQVSERVPLVELTDRLSLCIIHAQLLLCDPNPLRLSRGLADAYDVLSDPQRRSDYDRLSITLQQIFLRTN
jgi:hypothetical protein